MSIVLAVSATTRSFLDSMEQALGSKQEKEVRLNCLYTLSFEYGLIDPLRGIKYGRQCLKEAIEANNLMYQLNAYNGIGNAYETLARYDSARYYHQQSYKVAVKMKRPDKMALTLTNVALCDKELGDYRQALSNYISAYKIFQHQEVYNPRVHVCIAELYLRLGNYTQAEYHSRIGIQKCLQFHQDYILYNLYINLAKCQLHAVQYDSAIYNLEYALNGLLKHTDENSIAICYNELGTAYTIIELYAKAYTQFDKARQYYIRLKNTNGQITSSVNAANALIRIGNPNKSTVNVLLMNAENLFAHSSPSNTDVLLQAYEKTADSYERLGNNEKALYYYKRSFSLKDSLLNIEKYNQLLDLQTRYETQKKEFEILNLKQSDLIKSISIQDKDREIHRQYLLMLLGVFVLLLALVAVYFFIQKQRIKLLYEKQMAVKNAEENERIRMAKDIHDDLGSGLSKINFLTELIIRDKDSDKETVVNSEAIRETAQKLVVNMRDLIWALDPDNTSLEGLVIRIREYSNDYLEDVSIQFHLNELQDIPQLAIGKENYRAILMIVKESLNNIVKHAKASVVEMKINIQDNVFTLFITDNGIGMEHQQQFGNGMRNMKTRIESIGGIFKVKTQNGKGTSIEVSFPFDNK